MAENAVEFSDLARLLSRFDGLDSFGLLLFDSPGKWFYAQTPVRCAVFASTGGDGVHFGLLDIGHGITGTCPVVMTVPMADQPNRIVGQDLRHFLGIGLHSGYFILEQLQYDFAGTCAELDRREYEPTLSEQERAALAAIGQDLGAVPWQDHAAELVRLEGEFGAWL